MKKSDKVTVKYIPIGDMLAGKVFTSYDQIRKRTNEIVKPIRDNWLMSVLIKNNVFVNHAVMTRREVVAIYDKHKVSIVDEGEIYRVYKGDKIIGEWDNERRIRITKEGKLQVKIRYVIV